MVILYHHHEIICRCDDGTILNDNNAIDIWKRIKTHALHLLHHMTKMKDTDPYATDIASVLPLKCYLRGRYAYKWFAIRFIRL